MTDGTSFYRTHTAEGATHLDLLMATYDCLAEDLRLAAVAADAGDIAGRCKRSHHALLLLGHLESWTPLLEERSLEQSLTQFYLYARSELLRIQAAQETQALLALAMKVCEIRAAWQKRTASKSPDLPLAHTNPAIGQEASRLSWSA